MIGDIDKEIAAQEVNRAFAVAALKLWVEKMGKPFVAGQLELKSTETLERWIRQKRVPLFRVNQVLEAVTDERSH